jgi:hypothetical protein
MELLQSQNQTQIDRRVITAVLRAVSERNSFVVRYSDVYGQLRVLVAGEEFYGLENKMYEAISEGLLRGVYKFPGPCGDGSCDVIVVSPEPLSRGGSQRELSTWLGCTSSAYTTATARGTR